MTETAIQKDIIATARNKHHKVYRMNSGGSRVRHGYIHLAEEGTPDLLIVMSGGRSIWVEVKRPGERPTEIQAKRHRELRKMGHAVTTCCSVEDFIVAISEL